MSVYWVSFIATVTVMKAPLAGVPDGGAPTLIAGNQGALEAVAVDGTSVYWTTAGSGAGAPRMSASLGGVPRTAARPRYWRRIVDQPVRARGRLDEPSTGRTDLGDRRRARDAPLAASTAAFPHDDRVGAEQPSKEGVAIDGTDVSLGHCPREQRHGLRDARADRRRGHRGHARHGADDAERPRRRRPEQRLLRRRTLAYGRVLQMPKAPTDGATASVQGATSAQQRKPVE